MIQIAPDPAKPVNEPTLDFFTKVKTFLGSLNCRMAFPASPGPQSDTKKWRGISVHYHNPGKFFAPFSGTYTRCVGCHRLRSFPGLRRSMAPDARSAGRRWWPSACHRR